MAYSQLLQTFCTASHRTCFRINGLFGATYNVLSEPEKMPLTSLFAGPTLQSLTGFGGCDTVDSDSPIKRNLRLAGGLVAGKRMLILMDEHFLLPLALFAAFHETAPA
jgi:hypothetical protein